VRDARGETALKIALRGGYTRVSDVLKGAGAQ